MRHVAFLGALGLLSACHADGGSSSRPVSDASVLTTSDFEQTIGWGDSDSPSLTTERAHSGKWSVRVTPDVPFGYTYSRTFGNMSSTPLTHLVVEGWALRTAPGSTAKLVVQINVSATDETKVSYSAFPIEQAVPKFGEWTAISVPITLPTGTKGANKLKMYLWNDQGTSPTYLDDVILRKAE